MQHDERYRRPEDARTAASGAPAQPYMVGVPMAYPMTPEEGGVMYVNGVQPLSRRGSTVLIGVIVFATCILPLLIVGAVFLMMPDFDSFGGYEAPTSTSAPDSDSGSSSVPDFPTIPGTPGGAR